MSTHPYWSFAPDAAEGGPGPESFNRAVEEGRRAFALELAAQSLATAVGATIDDDCVNRAKCFEAYLKGELS